VELAAFLEWALHARGLRVPRNVQATVRKRLAKRVAALGLPSLSEYRAYLEREPAELNVFERMCRITISRFYRDAAVFESLAPFLRPGARVWSAGCASGEEPYTVAILEPNAEILATDAEEHLIERARRGCYPGGSLRELPAHLRERAFRREGELYCVRDEYRRAITFRCEDLRASMPDGPFDLVLCRNLAFSYFDEAEQRALAAKLIARLRPSGVLVIGARETLPAGVELEERAPSIFVRRAR